VKDSSKNWEGQWTSTEYIKANDANPKPYKTAEAKDKEKKLNPPGKLTHYTIRTVI
jgi:hypothetical protein